MRWRSKKIEYLIWTEWLAGDWDYGAELPKHPELARLADLPVQERSMDVVVMDGIQVSLHMDELTRKLRVEDNRGGLADLLAGLANEALAVAAPKALYKVVYVDSRDDDEVVLDGIALKSRVLAVNLADVHRVFPFLVTCGNELDRWAMSKSDLLERFYADAILDIVLRSARKAMKKEISQRFQLSKTAVMTPGSLGDWPIEQQRSLFSILGDTEQRIGVRLTESLMMTPVQSISGILFSTKVDFASCQLCPREGCPKRRARYDRDLYDKRFRKEHAG
jgi:hypothetical protein